MGGGGGGQEFLSVEEGLIYSIQLQAGNWGTCLKPEFAQQILSLCVYLEWLCGGRRS